MRSLLPEYLSIPPDRLGEGSNVKVRFRTDMADLAHDFAQAVLREIGDARQLSHPATLIVPVGPVDQYPILAEAINQQRRNCRDVMFIGMDEYLSEDGRWLDSDHPLSFRGFMDRMFYSHLEPSLAPKPECRVFPNPQHPDRIGEIIHSRGGVDACFGGFGINGHIAFNEPPEEEMTVEEFAALPTRVLDLTRETRTINCNTVGGELSVIPKQAVTVGMKEILASRRLCFYCNRPWQSAVVRRVLHGPITPTCPASLLRTHSDATITVTDFVAAEPDIRLR